MIAGQLYWATDIAVMCQWNGAAWVTQDGMQGEVRYVRGTNITTILAKYPGWIQITDISGCVLGIAGDGTASGLTARAPETTVGEEEHTQTLDELVSHSHPYTTSPTRTGIAGANPLWANDSTSNTGATGGGLPFNIMQPTRFLYAIEKL
jgi:hypothetical protein